MLGNDVGLLLAKRFLFDRRNLLVVSPISQLRMRSVGGGFRRVGRCSGRFRGSLRGIGDGCGVGSSLLRRKGHGVVGVFGGRSPMGDAERRARRF